MDDILFILVVMIGAFWLGIISLKYKDYFFKAQGSKIQDNDLIPFIKDKAAVTTNNLNYS